MKLLLHEEACVLLQFYQWQTWMESGVRDEAGHVARIQ